MTSGFQKTPEERTFHQLVDEEWEQLSEAARATLQRAHGITQKLYMVDNYGYHPDEYEDDMKAIGWTAAELTERDCEGLTKIWRSALAAASSVDPYDLETHLGYRVYPANFHRYYRELSRIVEDVEWEKRRSAFRKDELVEQEPADGADVPF